MTVNLSGKFVSENARDDAADRGHHYPLAWAPPPPAPRRRWLTESVGTTARSSAMLALKYFQLDTGRPSAELDRLAFLGANAHHVHPHASSGSHSGGGRVRTRFHRLEA